MSDLYPAVAHRFEVSFFEDFQKFPVDMRFQRISGLSQQMDVTSFREGGNNVGSVHFPERVTHGNLVLERGVMKRTNLSAAFDDALQGFRSRFMTVTVLLLNDVDKPLCSWVFSEAMPVSWSTGDLDASSNNVLINTLELAYSRMQRHGEMA